MNYEKHLLAFVLPGETGNAIIPIEQSKKQVKGLKIFAGGNANFDMPKKMFKQMLSRGHLEVVEKMPNDVFKDIVLTWENNKTKPREITETPVEVIRDVLSNYKEATQ